MNKIRLGNVIALTTLLMLGAASAQQQGVEMIQKPLPESEPTDWWRTSWKAGYQYFHDAQFELVCDTKFTPGETPRWLDKTAAANLDAGASLRIGGIAHASSFVLEGSPSPLLARYYESIHIDRTLSGKFLFLSNTTKGMHQWLFSGGIHQTVKNAVNWIASAVLSYILEKPIPPRVPDMSGVGDRLGKAAQEGTEKYLKEKGLVIGSDGFEIKTDSDVFNRLPFASDLKGVDNLAVQMTEDFRNRLLLMEVSAGKLTLHDGTDSAEKLFSLMNKPSEAKQLIAKLQEPSSDRVKAVLQRETLALNKAIFDGKTRKVGDVWTIDGSVLAGFLHPDLKGNFQGRVVLKYEKNDPARKSNHYKDQGAIYTAQVLRILPAAQIANENVISNLEYVEPNFRAKINDETEATIYLDAKSAMVREVILAFQSNASQQVLPDLVITSGLQAAGKVRLQIDFFATCAKISETP